MTEPLPRPIKEEAFGHPVADAWRPVFAEVVRRLVDGDYALARAVPRVRSVPPDIADHIRAYVEQYNATLVELCDESWQTSVAQWMDGHWEVLVDLWTAEEGRSDLVLHSRVFETAESFEVEVGMVYVP